MPRSNWSKLSAFGLIVTALLSFGGAAWLISDANRLQSFYEQEAEANAQRYADRSKIAVQNRCASLAPAPQYECIREENETARQGIHDEYDLQAQLVTSVWTRYMGIAAMIGMGVGILGVGLVYSTFNATREANVIARAEAARAEADATAARKHIIQTERAILAVRYMSADPVSEGDAFIRLRLHLRNDGRSNAWGIQIAQHTRSSRVFPSKFSLSPPLPMISLADKDVTTPVFRMRVPKSFPAFLSGYVSYTTAHDATFRAFFIYRFDCLPYIDSHGGGGGQPIDVSGEAEIPTDT